MTQGQARAQVIVIGAGPAGLTAAIALASGGVETVLVGKRPATPDHRTTALMASSVAALKALGVWPHCCAQAAPFAVMRLVDDTGRLWRAPEVSFAAAEIGLEAFAYNVENKHLLAALDARAAELGALKRVEAAVEAVDIGADHATVHAPTGTMHARLIVGADGRRSVARGAAGIETRDWSYPQAALTVNFRHSRPHADTSTEFHTAAGPFTLVPLLGLRSSLVWVVDPFDADDIRRFDDTALSAEIERRSHSILGKVAVEPGRGHFPLAGETAVRFGQQRVALVGEAAHVIPPIGAQGLNLGLRDAATIAELVVDAHAAGGDPGGENLLARYDRARRADITSRVFAVDLLNRTLLSNFLPVQSLRGLGLYLLDRIGPLRRTLMREGVAPAANSPRLMRGEPL